MRSNTMRLGKVFKLWVGSCNDKISTSRAY